MKFSTVWNLFALLLIATFVTAQWAEVLEALEKVATIAEDLEKLLESPFDQPMKNAGERQDGDVFLVTAQPKYNNMNINFMIQVDLPIDIITLVRNSVNNGDSLRELEEKLQQTGSSTIYETLLRVPKGLQYSTATCNRKYVKFCSYTYDAYVGIGSSPGWGWNKDQLKSQSAQYEKTYRTCNWDRYCPAN
ncbi:hypothetical protein BJ944DRAFT_260166 [Cunninghamella echinulata]|nr:hypothetical protein BJ944DRAFT_260166 [Cunninghamella echinulata]